MDCSLPGFSVHGILQARILEWFTISFSRGSSQPRDRTRVSRIGGRHFNLWATREAQVKEGRAHFLTSLTLPSTVLDESSSSDLTTNNTQEPEYAGWGLCFLVQLTTLHHAQVQRLTAKGRAYSSLRSTALSCWVGNRKTLPSVTSSPGLSTLCLPLTLHLPNVEPK